MTQLQSLLVKHEGMRTEVYTCPAGKLTIGVGRNLEDNGVTEEEALLLLDNDLANARESAIKIYGVAVFDSLTDARQAVIQDMIVNMGAAGYSNFKNHIAAVKSSDWPRAAAEMLDSKWASQVGNRATEDATMMETGEWPE